MIEIPEFCKTDLETIARMVDQAKRADVWELCKTPGGRPLIAFCYGEKQDITHRANYSSACGDMRFKRRHSACSW